MLGASAVVGTNIPIALGWALSFKMRGDNRMVACFFGDGATEEGVFYESLNFASLHRLPVLFVCENNFYAIHTPLRKRWANDELCARVAGFGLPTRQITDGDVLAIAEGADEFVADIRAGSGPMFMECQIYRWLEHVGPSEDFAAGYRDRGEAEPWRQSDAVVRIGSRLSDQERATIDDEIEAEIGAAIEFAEASPEPERSDLYDNVYSG